MKLAYHIEAFNKSILTFVYSNTIFTKWRDRIECLPHSDKQAKVALDLGGDQFI